METDILELVRQAKKSFASDGKILLIYLLKKMRDSSIELTEEQRKEYAECAIMLLDSRLTALQSAYEQNYGGVTQSFIDKLMRLVKKISRIPEVIGYADLNTRIHDSFFLRTIKFLLDIKEKVDKQCPSQVEWKVSLVESCFMLSFAYPDFMNRNQRYNDTLKKKLREFGESKKIEERELARKFESMY